MAEVKSWFLCSTCYNTLTNPNPTDAEPVGEFFDAVREIVKSEGMPRVKYFLGESCESCKSCGVEVGQKNGRAFIITVISHHLERIRKMENCPISTKVNTENGSVAIELSFVENGVERKASGNFEAKYGKKSGKRLGTISPNEFVRLFLDACQIMDPQERAAVETALLRLNAEPRKLPKFLERAKAALLKKIRESLQNSDVEVFVQHVSEKCADREVGRRLVETICAKHEFSEKELEEML